MPRWRRGSTRLRPRKSRAAWALKLIIDVGQPSDAAALAHVHRAARQMAMPWMPDLHSPADDRIYFAAVLRRENVLVARQGDAVAGFIAIHQDWLNHLYIAPPYWRRGIGATLLKAASKELSELQLWTFQQNHAARAFYAAQGFTEVELTDGSGNEEKLPDVRMIWAR